MENKLDILSKKLYDEGIDKAQKDADAIIAKAKKDAEDILAKAKKDAEDIRLTTEKDVENFKKKAETEMTLSAKQAIAALKQAISAMLTEKVAKQVVKTAFDDKTYIQELLISIVKKWDLNSGNLDLNLILSQDEKEQFENFVSSKYKELLDKGLELKLGGNKEAFIIQPKDASYQVAFSDQLFESFFEQYMKTFTKKLLYKE